MLRTGILILLVLSAFLIAGCASVPLNQPKSFSTVLVNTNDTYFGEAAIGWARLHDGKSGFYPLPKGMDGLGARLGMANKAQKSIDLQYFLMKDDNAGLVMRNALLKAADRGVRVRFLLDDIFTSARDRSLQLLSQHPNIEVRLFNPVSRKGISFFNFLGSFSRANRRMHNKSFTVDNAISVIGGRNIADEYFQLKEDVLFSDFDMLALGPIAHEISASFDQFWNHDFAIPIEQLSNSEKAGNLATERPSFDKQENQIYTSVYAKALESKVLQDLISGRESLYAADARVLADDPDKLKNAVGVERMLRLATELDVVLRDATHEIMFLSPYYVPGKDGVQYVKNLVDKGVRVVMVTNSLASTNHIPVHSAYASYRKAVIDAGVELYEVRANAGRAVEGGDGPEAMTMHTKLILIDRRYLFVGSLNLDPRSIKINAEMGLLIDVPDLVEQMAIGVDDAIPKFSYHVVRSKQGSLLWEGEINGQKVTETSEPLSSVWRRIKAWIMKLAPEGQL